jgi:hypothetical protein
METLNLFSKAADSISDGDLLDRLIHGYVSCPCCAVESSNDVLNIGQSNIGHCFQHMLLRPRFDQPTLYMDQANRLVIHQCHSLSKSYIAYYLEALSHSLLLFAF